MPAHVRGVAVGAVGTVLLTALPFGACRVSFGAMADPVAQRPPRYYQVRSVHLRRLSAGGSDGAEPDASDRARGSGGGSGDGGPAGPARRGMARGVDGS